MYLIDKTYFTGDLVLPDSGGIDVQPKDNDINLWIDKYACRLLQNALGHELFEELDSQIDNGKLKDDADEKWKKLVNGTIYSYRGQSYLWKGLLFKDGLSKGSVLAHYVYFHWLKAQGSRMSGVGEVRGNAINATNVSSTQRLVRIWNEFVNLYQSGYSVYPHDRYAPYFHRGTAFRNSSLINFLHFNPEDYPKALLKLEQGYINSMGL